MPNVIAIFSSSSVWSFICCMFWNLSEEGKLLVLDWILFDAAFHV